MSSESLTLLHGWGMNPCVFEPLRTRFDTRLAVSMPALPGYPDSPWPGSSNFEAQLDRMARDLPAGQLLGWSLGGLYAIELARRFPRQFSALTLVACNPCFVTRANWPCAVAGAVFDEFSDDLTRDWQRTLRRFLALQMQGEADARSLSRSLWQQIIDVGRPDTGVLQFGLELLRKHDARPALGNLELPVTLILGERDLLVPIDLAQQIADVAPGIQVESVAGAAHAPFLSHPTRVAALL